MIILSINGETRAQQTVNNAKIITITNFKVYEKNTQLIIDWSTKGDLGANYWQVQSRTNSQKYNIIALVFGPDPNQKGNRYQFKGKIKESAGNKTSYRVVPIDIKGQEIDTEIIQPAK